MTIEKENLLTTDYVWPANNTNNLLSEGPTRKRFDRYNGNCMLHIIHLFDYCVDKLNVAQAQEIERLILEELPLESKSEVSVLQWLKSKQVQIFSLHAAEN